MSIDGHSVLPLPVVLSKKGLTKKQRQQVWEPSPMNCFSGGFLANDLFFSPTSSSKEFAIAPKRALTVSFVAKAPRYSSMVCSVDGCHPKGTLRFSVTVNTTEFVSVWQGQSMVNCGV